MVCIQKRTASNGAISYRVRIRVAGMPLKTATFATRTEAKKWALKMESEIRGGRYFGLQEQKEKTFAEFVDRYIEKELPKNPNSYAKCKAQLLWWKKHLGQYFLCHITPPMIADLRDLLQQEKTPRKTLRSSSTTNRYLAALSKAFTIAIKEWGWVKENPVLKISRPKENKPRERYLEKEERKKRVILSEYVFPKQDGKGPADIRGGWEMLIKKANLQGVCFHSLRHTAASHLGMGGASTLEIAAILGHKTLAMVKRYSHFSLSATAKALKRMNETIFAEQHSLFRTV